MNAFLYSNLFIIVLILLFIILFLVALITFILIKFVLPSRKNLSINESLDTDTSILPMSISPQVFKKLLHEPVVEKYFCENHPEIPSVGSCLICEDVFCEKCLIEHDGLYFCKEHFKIFANYKWVQITDVMTTPNTPNDGLFIYHFKRYIWQEKKIPSFVLTHYKINIEEDFIESFIQLNVIEENAEKLLDEIEKFKASL
jgi:hypothetical protein